MLVKQIVIVIHVKDFCNQCSNNAPPPPRVVNNQNHIQNLFNLYQRLVLTYMTTMLCVLDITPVLRIQPYCVCLEFILRYVDRHVVCIMKLA